MLSDIAVGNPKRRVIKAEIFQIYRSVIKKNFTGIFLKLAELMFTIFIFQQEAVTCCGSRTLEQESVSPSGSFFLRNTVS